MIPIRELDDKILASFSKPDEVKIEEMLKSSLGALNRKIVVLDDDPTGIQTVHGVSVYTDWNLETIRQGFEEESSMFFILTNSRGLTASDTRVLHADIAEGVARISRETGKEYILVSRGDSILRGHYPLETQTLKDVIEANAQTRFDGEIICPFFKEGGRFTLENVHYVHEGKRLIPAGETEFAKDKTFGYKASHLGAWIEEKTQGEYRADDVTYISLEDLRRLEIDKITGALMQVDDFGKVVVNAVDYCDLKVFVIALAKAMASGKHFLVRSAASITKVLGNVSDRPLLGKRELVGQSEHGGLIVIGSYTQKTTAQFNELNKLEAIQLVEFNSELIWDQDALDAEVLRVRRACEKSMASGQTVAFYTSRKPLKLKDTDKENALKASLKISDAVTSIVSGISVKPAFIVAKGGITSSEVGTKALTVKKAHVMGQIKPGIPVWKTDAQSRFGSMPYIIFPGNVGGVTTLREIAEELMC